MCHVVHPSSPVRLLSSVQYALFKCVLHIILLHLYPEADFQGGPLRVDFYKHWWRFISRFFFYSHIMVNLFKLGFSLHTTVNGGGNQRMFTSDLFLATLNVSKQRFSVMKCLAGESVRDFAVYRPARLPRRLMPACFVCWFSVLTVSFMHVMSGWRKLWQRYLFGQVCFSFFFSP